MFDDRCSMHEIMATVKSQRAKVQVQQRRVKVQNGPKFISKERIFRRWSELV